MKKVLALFTTLLFLTGCGIMNKQGTISPTDLHHRNYVLINFDGQEIEPKNMIPRIEFGENFYVNGVMCNTFAGQGKLSGNILKATNVVSTRAMCFEAVKNQLDVVIAEMLSDGVEISLDGGTLTLANKDHTLIFTNRDWVY